MATINPNLPLSTHNAARPTSAPPQNEAQTPLPTDGLSVDFSQTGKVQAESKPSKAPADTPAPSAAPATPAPQDSAGNVVVGGVALAAADGGFAVSNTGGLAQLDGQTKAPDFDSNIDGCLAKLCGTGAPKEIRTTTAADVNWEAGAEVVSGAQKFVIPVPAFEGEPLVYPAGAKDKDGNDLGGTPIKDWQGQPIGDKGVVFWNDKDQAWQAVKSDGEGVVIMNQVTEDQGKLLMEKVGADPGKLTLEQFKDVLSYAFSEVGCKDMYNSDRGFISKKMNPLETHTTGIPQYGLFRRDDRDVCKALFTQGPGEFEAPTTGGIMVKQPIPEEGGVLVRQPDGKVFLYRKVDLEVMEQTYRYKDGSKLVATELPEHVY